ncbi:MAG TPA: A/G-specific adenine glycosylase [Hyphomicrobiaceae bacterium]|nr:A/G-specific adenine glycosylase [Hyphomicrobiaceae bacterium]
MSTVARTQRLSRAGRGTAGALLEWYDNERRDLPWRYGPGVAADPYRVWLSEIMLQQTTVKAVIPYFEKFVALWPTVEGLALAEEEAVLQAWAGLGYYSRARNLHACAQAVVTEHGGVFPVQEQELRRLPGIGPYTAAAIAAIAFGQPAMPVDGNVERVVSRLFAVTDPMPKSKPLLRDHAAGLMPGARTGDFAQAMMDLGATVCTPKRPSCLMCPLQNQCDAHALGMEGQLPVRAVKPDRPVRRGIAFVTLAEDGTVLLRQRPDTGLLARMLEVPSTEWQDDAPDLARALRGAPVRASWWLVPGQVVHTFTHFRLEMQVYRAVVPVSPPLTFWADSARCRWVPKRELDKQALPSVMRKLIAHGMSS